MGRRKKPEIFGNGTRAVVYLRVSREDGDTKHGLEVQQDYCAEYVERLGYTVVETTQDDGISGAKGLDDRPGLRHALALCEAGDVDVLVCYAADRISREVGLFVQVRDRLVKCHARLETFKENQDFTKAESLFMGDIYAAVAAEDRRRIAARLYGGRRVRSKRDGRGSSSLPYGYTKDLQGHVAIDPPATQSILKIAELRMSGASYQATADALNDAKLSAPKGGTWQAGQVHWVAQHMELYLTGKRIWDGIEAAQAWPVIIDQSDD